MPTRTINGTSLYFEISGRGTPLLFIHGHGLAHDMFRPQMEFFKRSYLVIGVDLRGNGQSGKLHCAPERIIDLQCEDLSLLLGHLGIRQAVLIGADYGGILAQRFAYLYPEQVSALIIADSLCKNIATTLLGKAFYALSVASKVTYYLPGEFYLRSLKVMYNRWDLAYRTLRRAWLHKRASELLIQSIAASWIDYSPLLPRIQVPAFCLAGDHSEYDVRQMQEIARLLPLGQFRLVEDAFHPSNLCQPNRFNELVLEFLGESKVSITAGS